MYLSSPRLHLLLPVWSLWMSNGLAIPASMPANAADAYPTATETRTFTTVYWTYSPSSLAEPADGLPPVASVFSAMAHHTTLLSSPSPVSHHGGPGIVVVEDPTSNPDALTCPEAFKARIRKCEKLAAALGAIAAMQALIAFCLAIYFCRRRIRKDSKDHGEKSDSWTEEGAMHEKGVNEPDERLARQSWWTGKVVDIRRRPSDKLAVPLAVPTPLSAPIVLPHPSPRPNPNLTPHPVHISERPVARLRLSMSTPLLHSPSPMSSNPAGAGNMSTAEFLASLDLNRNSTASTSSSFTTAETHPEWITHTHPQAQTEAQNLPQDHPVTNSTPAVKGIGDHGRKSQESTRSEWDIAKWYSGRGSRYDKTKSTVAMDGMEKGERGN
jgi:hypothetical protein